MAPQIKTAPQQSRIVNKAGMAAFFGISLPTADSWLRNGCPIVSRGDSGTPWQIDLLEAAKWRFGPKPTAETEAGKLDPQQEKARLDSARATLAEIAVQEKAGTLIQAEIFREALADSFKHLAMTLESLPDLLERDAGITGGAVDRAIIVLDKAREQLYARLIQ